MKKMSVCYTCKRDFPDGTGYSSLVNNPATEKPYRYCGPCAQARMEEEGPRIPTGNDIKKGEKFLRGNLETAVRLGEAEGLLRIVLSEFDNTNPFIEDICAFIGHECTYDTDKSIATCACGKVRKTWYEFRYGDE